MDKQLTSIHPLKGRKQTAEHIEARVSKLRGRCSEKRRDMCLKNGFQKGNRNWNAGKLGIYSSDALEKMRNAKIGKPPPVHKNPDCKCFRCSPKYQESNPNWNNGRAKKRDLIRRALRQWRESILIRDEFTCVLCKCVGGRLEAHHIRPVNRHIDLASEITNGVTLCTDCHKSVTRREKEFEQLFFSYTQGKTSCKIF